MQRQVYWCAAAFNCGHFLCCLQERNRDRGEWKMNILRDRRRRKVPGRGQLRGGGSHDNGPFGLAKNHLAINKSGDGGGGFPFLKKKSFE